MTEIKYEVVRTARRTLCVSVKDGKVIVRAPYRVSAESIERFVRQKTAWIVAHLTPNNPYYDGLASLEQIYAKGRLLPFIIGGENFISDKCVSVRSLSSLKKLYVSTFGAEFMDILNVISARSGLNARSVSFKAYSARWGCCDSKGCVIFNYKLLMLPTELWRCVIVHELCHTVYMNHSEKFYALAEEIMPGYKEVRKRLKTFACVCRLYR